MRHSEIAGRIGVARRVFQLVPDLRTGLQVRVALDEQARDIGVLLRDRPHQRGLPAFQFGCVDVGAVLEKPLDGPTVTAATPRIVTARSIT